MQTQTITTYTLAELKNLDNRAYERALDKLREGESCCFQYEDPFACGWGSSHIQGDGIPVLINGRISITELSDNPTSCEIDWKRTEWDFASDVLDYLNDDVARKIDRIMRVIGCDLHEFLSFGQGYYSRNSILEPHYRYRANSRTKRIDAVISEVVEAIDTWLREIEHFIAKDYSQTVEYTYSEENLLEVAEINNYQFDELGDLL